VRGGALLVSRYTNWFPFFITIFEELGYSDVHVTDKGKDALNMLINEVNHQYLFINSMFYSCATPLMIGKLLWSYPKLHITAVTLLNPYPDNMAMWFIFHGAKSYIKAADGKLEFLQNIRGIREGKAYIVPAVQAIIDGLPEWPEVQSKAAKRQLEVLVMLCNGNSLEELAKSLGISCKTGLAY